MEKEISRFYAFFRARRVGGIKAKNFPRALDELVIIKFGSAMYVDRLTANLAEGVALIMLLYKLRGEIDLDKLEDKGIKEEIIHHLKTIDQLWARMDNALLMLARQKYVYDCQAVTSVDGMEILINAVFAVSLHEFLENLDLLQGDKFMEKIEAWRKGMESILIAILKSLGREKEAHQLAETSETATESLETRVQGKINRYPFEQWRISTGL